MPVSTIRIPPRVSVGAPQSQHLEPPLRRKANNRRVDSDEDDDDGDADPLNIRPQIPTVKQLRTSETMNDDGQVEIDPNIVETKVLPDRNSRRSPPSKTVSPKIAKMDGGRPKSARSKKKRPMVESEDEDEYQDKDDTPDSPHHPPATETDSENYLPDQKQPGTSAKQKHTKRKATKAGGGSKATKGKATKESQEQKESKESTTKHERGGVPVTHSTQLQENPTVTNKRSRPKEVAKEDIAVDVVGDVVTTPESQKLPVVEASGPTKEATSPQPPIKKRKLPTIKKTKTPASTGLAAPLNSTIPKLPTTPNDADGVSKLPAVETRIPAANVGSADFDLRKPSVYAELFKSGSTPRSGLNRRERDDERRKELYKMRDEARAKRAAEARHTFDLQGQRDKISRFEERLRHENSAVLFPNFLAAKFKDDWERQRRKQSRAKKENGVEGRLREEGETDDSKER